MQNEPGQGDEEREAVMNIDTAISSDHARIEMDPSTGPKPYLFSVLSHTQTRIHIHTHTHTYAHIRTRSTHRHAYREHNVVSRLSPQ